MLCVEVIFIAYQSMIMLNIEFNQVHEDIVFFHWI